MSKFFLSTNGAGPITLNLGKTLRLRRQAAKLSQRGLAQRCGLSRMEIHYLETGSRRPKVDTVEILCAGLGIGVLELMAEAERHGRTGCL